MDPRPPSRDTIEIVRGRTLQDAPTCRIHRHAPSPDTKWRVDLSGGGVRAALAGIGALWWLGRTVEPSRVDTIVSVSGGSLVNAAIMNRQPSDASWNSELVGLFDRLRLTPRSFASAVGLFGCYLLVALGSFGTREFVDQHWLPIGGFLAVWLLCLPMARVMIRPLILLAVVISSIDVRVPSNVQDRGAIIGAAALGAVSLLTDEWSKFRVRKRLRRGGALPATRRQGRVRDVLDFLTSTGALPLYAAAALKVQPWSALPDSLRSTVLGIVGSFGVATAITPAFFRSYTDWVVRGSRKLTAGDAAAPHAHQPVRSHVICLTELRSEQPAFFMASAADGVELETIDWNGEARRGDASAVRLNTIVHAAISGNAPVTLGANYELARSRRPMLVDGGLHGTLGTQYVRVTPAEGPRAHLVVDATRHPRRIRWWPLLSYPKVGSALLKFRFLQVTLGQLVALERARLRDDPTVYFAASTGATDHASVSCTCPGAESDAVRRAMHGLQAQTDRRTFWFMGSKNAARCVASGALASMLSVQQVDMKQVVRLLGDVEQTFGVSLAMPATAGIAPLAHRHRFADWRQRARRCRRAFTGRMSLTAAASFVVCLAVTVPVVGGMFATNVCGPVCKDRSAHGEQHQFFTAFPQTGMFGQPYSQFIAVSHEGVHTGNEPISLSGFQQAYDLGFRYMETDIAFTTDGRLVAHHVDLTEGAPYADGLLDAGSVHEEPTMRELLADPTMPDARWNFEFSLLMDGDDLAQFEKAVIEQLGDDSSRVCIHWGRTVDSDKVEHLRALLPTDTCNCATTMERERNSRLPPLRFIAAMWDTGSTVDCSVVVDAVAASARPVGDGVVLMSWPTPGGQETAASLSALIDAGLVGIMTDNPELLRNVLIHRGMWPRCFEQPVTVEVLEYPCPPPMPTDVGPPDISDLDV